MNVFESMLQTFENRIVKVKRKQENKNEADKLISAGKEAGPDFKTEANTRVKVDEVKSPLTFPEYFQEAAAPGKEPVPDEREKEISANDLLAELKKDISLNPEDEFGILKVLEDVSAGELVEDLKDLLSRAGYSRSGHRN